MANFTGQLRSNEIFAALYNMIISQQVFADNIRDTFSELADRFRVDGSLYGDTKLYYSTDVLKSAPWGNDAEATNLLALYRPEAPECQAITLDVFRQICLTVDNYLSKRAWGTEGAFSEFNSVMLGWIRDTKRVYDATLVNSYVGTAETKVGLQDQSITFQEVEGDLEATNRLEGQAIAEKIANLMIQLRDPSRDFNDYGNLRSYRPEDIVVVWNSNYYNKILKVDLPTIFHRDGLVDKLNDYYLPSRYFGKVNATGGTVPTSNTTIRSLIETDYTVSEQTYHVFPGDLLPSGATYKANETYTTDGTIICKIMHKNSIPFMSAFEVGTSFFNPKSLTETHYLTWGHNTLEYLQNYPMITLRGIEA